MDCKIRRSRKAKRILLKVEHDGAVEVVVPWWVAKRHGERFFRDRLPWVKRVQEKVRTQREKLPARMIDEQKLRTAAKEFFEREVGQFAQQFGIANFHVVVSHFKRQWGSANKRTGRLAFSWRLMLAPEAVARYVAAHEVAHLVYVNHSPTFWRLVERLMPDFKGHRRWLKRNGASLAL